MALPRLHLETTNEPLVWRTLGPLIDRMDPRLFRHSINCKSKNAWFCICAHPIPSPPPRSSLHFSDI
ncbi:hypothetical protein M413DRAFT_438762 [Hebeloma cylindrosporum]|uniref:Uncharacterized protein n=1 Tax=Hebeloma cylindrosporum TaxID=76867 RepID=A0A0C3D0D3_HEBCY|nr:hypothetical protein M413DRAFT_438762 [Hebeloma cylindrosporum h7]